MDGYFCYDGCGMLNAFIEGQRVGFFLMLCCDVLWYAVLLTYDSMRTKI